MFEYFRNKKLKLRWEVLILGSIVDVIMKYKTEQKKAQEAVEKAEISEEELAKIAKTIKGLSEKDMLNAVVEFMKSKEGK